MGVIGLPPSLDRGLRTIELRDEDEPRLQRFFEANPEYFVAVQGEPARAGQAYEEIRDRPPTGWPFSRSLLVGYVDGTGTLAAVVRVVCDLLAPGVRHIGLLVVATARHGTGDAQRIYRGLEEWAGSDGATWMRLGVVKGNARAERFWASLGFTEVRTREGVAIGKRTHTIRVMVKPLASAGVGEYLRMVPRDRPEPTAKA